MATPRPLREEDLTSELGSPRSRFGPEVGLMVRGNHYMFNFRAREA